MKNHKIVLQYGQCLSDAVGSKHGISFVRLQEMCQLYRDARMRIIAKKNAHQIGFMDLPFSKTIPQEVKKIARKIKGKFQNFVVVGIGGSALSNNALQTALRDPFWNLLSDKDRKNYPRLFVADNIDPALIKGLLNAIDIKKTVFNVISKSGTTAECLANYFIFKNMLIKKVGKKYAQQIIITTDSAQGYLREHAEQEKITTLSIPGNVGGRFSVLSSVGLLSAAATGIDIDELLKGARAMHDHCDTEELFKNCAAIFALINCIFYQQGKHICVILPYSHALKDCADWFRQLWAESLGKRINNENAIINIGPTPIKALGVTDQHSQMQLYIEGPYDKLVVFISVEKYCEKMPLNAPRGHYLYNHTLSDLFKAEEEATRAALTKNERPHMTIIVPEVTPNTVGQLIFMLELATAYAGEFFRINAFDQPGVELGKVYTYARLGRKGYETQKHELDMLLRHEKHGKNLVGHSYCA